MSLLTFTVIFRSLIDPFGHAGDLLGFRYYSAIIIQMAGVKDKHDALWLTSLTSAVLLVMQAVGALSVDKLGRRPLILVSLLGGC